MIDALERFVRALTWRTAQAAQLAMVFLMMITVINVIIRVPWRPIGGTVELVEMAGAIMLSLGIAYTAIVKGHIMVGVLVERFPKRVQGFVEIVVSSISLFFSLLLAREITSYGLRMMERGYMTGHLGVPIAPSILLTAFGFVMLSLVLLLDLIKAVIIVTKGRKQE